MNQEPTKEEIQRKAVGEVVASLRQELGMSQEKLAEHADCHRNNIGLIERGERTASIYNLHLIANALRISASQLLKEAGY